MAKYTVGANPWAIHRDTEVFDPDVEAFKPERWLEKGSGDKGKFGFESDRIGVSEDNS